MLKVAGFSGQPFKDSTYAVPGRERHRIEAVLPRSMRVNYTPTALIGTVGGPEFVAAK
jgi:hypothetical protein